MSFTYLLQNIVLIRAFSQKRGRFLDGKLLSDIYLAHRSNRGLVVSGKSDGSGVLIADYVHIDCYARPVA